MMDGGDWGKWNVLYTTREYVDAQRKELRRFTGAMSPLEWIAVIAVLGLTGSFLLGVAWRLFF